MAKKLEVAVVFIVMSRWGFHRVLSSGLWVSCNVVSEGGFLIRVLVSSTCLFHFFSVPFFSFCDLSIGYTN